VHPRVSHNGSSTTAGDTASPGGEVPGPRPAAAWQRELAEAIRDPEELARELGIDGALIAHARPAAGGFPLLVPRAFVRRMRRGDPHDPLLRQVLPVAAEEIPMPGFTDDPLAEAASVAAPGLVRKYAGRCLLLLTGGCAVHCRYCFRRAFPYADFGVNAAGIDAALAAIAADGTLAEVILSGGDPLLLDDGRLATIVARLARIPHVRRLRIHTRLPIVLPSRVTPALTRLLAESGLACVVVVHANHAAELDGAVASAVRRLAAAPALLLNQAVLLAGVNDDVQTLRSLSERLVEIGVVPYYLHLLDRVSGTAHFEVSESRARGLLAELRASLPGYAVPRLARELPGEPAKVWIA
jgi:EF-P beta-lysylation protein EpmB